MSVTAAMSAFLFFIVKVAPRGISSVQFKKKAGRLKPTRRA
jgi:hypothetical protein